ncbi:family 16 glycosylhydrolase [Actinoplanes sp. NPDC051859]|uniref:glycoside hydrolase family 16 protein n=1 Tax=Actinoplanes sp. NPDC051859 TaxID=3363909 RepID=UPI003791CCA8
MKVRLVALSALTGLASLAVPHAGQASVRAVQPTQVLQASEADLPSEADPDWTKVFQDDFKKEHKVAKDGDGFSVWTVDDVPVWKNVGEVRVNGVWKPKPIDSCGTVDTADPGLLKLKPFPKNDPDTQETRWRCRITSVQKFEAGTHLFAAKIKVHRSTGHLSSFWLNTARGVDQPINEIDVIENAGVKNQAKGCEGSPKMATNRDDYYGLNHTYYSAYKPKPAGYKHCLSKANAEPLIDDQFHVFQAEWAPDKHIKFSIDGRVSATYGAQYAKGIPLNAILTNIGAEADTAGERNFQVDWVKVWKKTPQPSGPPPVPPTCDNDCWRAQLGVQSYNYRPNSNPADVRLARIVFDRQFYLDSYADVRTWAQNKVATQGGNIYDHAQWHWLNYGVPQGRIGAATFDPAYYMAHQPDVAAAYGATNYQGAITHYLAYGRVEGRRGSVFFDPGYYKARYGDLAAFPNADAVDHFTIYGMNEGRQGSADFAPAWYMGTFPDLRNAFGSNNYRSGMSHWYSNGRQEGRPATP